MEGYKTLISYQLTLIAFNLVWEFVPIHYYKIEDGRQRDQLKQAMRSFKQNIVEGSEERSLSSKLKLYDVARASGGELLEDLKDILRLEGLPRWNKADSRLGNLKFRLERRAFSDPSCPSLPSCASILGGGNRGTRGNRWTREEIETIVNYLIDVVIRARYLLDQQIRAVEERHTTEGGYNENLLKKRLEYRNSNR
jgi:four helix bundle suffix protein